MYALPAMGGCDQSSASGAFAAVRMAHSGWTTQLFTLIPVPHVVGVGDVEQSFLSEGALAKSLKDIWVWIIAFGFPLTNVLTLTTRELMLPSFTDIAVQVTLKFQLLIVNGPPHDPEVQ